jgi:SAM-dependent methyltransferase
MSHAGAPGHRFYTELAEFWPLISPPEEYVDEADELADLLGTASIPVRDVLELGSGGGHNAVHLSRRFALTLVDLSEPMLVVSRRLNPGCTHVAGDMRTVRLGRLFDAVLVHDAIDYMATRDDLRQALVTAREHCRPGGLVLLAPDHTVETFEPGTDHGGTDAPDGRGARYLEWSRDPDPSDTQVTTDYAFLLRDAHGSVRAVHETHVTGLFDRATWLTLLTEVGFSAERVVERDAGNRTPRDFFVGRR